MPHVPYALTFGACAKNSAMLISRIGSLADRFQSALYFIAFGKRTMPAARTSANESHAAIMFIEKPPAINPSAEQNAINTA